MIRKLKNRWPTDIHYHEWFQYADSNGHGYCEPEAYVVLKECVVLFECKLTGGWAGKMQMEGLYAPLLEEWYKRPVRSLQICKYINAGTPEPFFDSPEKFLQSGLSYGTWHLLDP